MQEPAAALMRLEQAAPASGPGLALEGMAEPRSYAPWLFRQSFLAMGGRR